MPTHTKFQLNEGAGDYSVVNPVSGDEIIEMATAILSTSLKRSQSDPLSNPATVRAYLKLKLARQRSEMFAVMFLDNRHRMIAFESLFRGTIHGASVHPREVVRAAIHHNAAAVILPHNHPSGVAEPSDADRRITQRLKEALALIDVRVLDHFVIGEGEPTSFAERGLL